MAKTEAAHNERPAREAKRRTPRFKTTEEEAEYWDTHSTADFEDEFQEVKDVKFVVRRAPVDKVLTVRLDQDTYVRLAKEARDQGVGPTTLVRMWILEHFRRGRDTAA